MQRPLPLAICPVCDSDLVLAIEQWVGKDICKKCDVRVSDRFHDITRQEWHNALDIGETNIELAEQGFLLL